MLVYSAIKNIANLKLAYSVWKPATSSDSASGRSNGARLVSAMAATKKQKKPRICGQMFQLKIPCQPKIPGPACASDRKSTRLNSSHGYISYAVFCLKKKKK